MSYTLYGSRPSHFVRRIRMVMENIPFTFDEMNIFETEDAIKLNKINPVNQVPVLMDGDVRIWDSRQIFYYLNRKHNLCKLSLEDENTLTAIEGGMSAGVTLLMMKRSGLNIQEPYMVVTRQKERIESVLDYIKPYLMDQGLKEWNFITISLYSFLDWAIFREVAQFDHRPEVAKFLSTHAHRPIVKQTDPRV